MWVKNGKMSPTFHNWHHSLKRLACRRRFNTEKWYLGRVMLVTKSWRKFSDVGDRISVLVTCFECWCPTFIWKDSGCWWPKWPKRSSTSTSCHQHISSPTSITNIDDRDFFTKKSWFCIRKLQASVLWLRIKCLVFVRQSVYSIYSRYSLISRYFTVVYSDACVYSVYTYPDSI